MSNRVLVPEDLHRNGRAAVASLARAGLAIALHAVDRATYPNPHQHVVRSWATDREAALLVRAASEPPAEMASLPYTGSASMSMTVVSSATGLTWRRILAAQQITWSRS